MSLIETIFDHTYYSDAQHLGDASWRSAVEHFSTHGAGNCAPPNGLDLLYTEFYTKVQGSCTTQKEWFDKSYPQNAYDLLSGYIFSQTGKTQAVNKLELYQKAIQKMAESSLANVEALAEVLSNHFEVGKINFYLDTILNVLALKEEYTPSNKVIEFTLKELESKQTNPVYNKKEYLKATLVLLARYAVSENVTSGEFTVLESFLNKPELSEALKIEILKTLFKGVEDPKWKLNLGTLGKLAEFTELGEFASNFIDRLLEVYLKHDYYTTNENLIEQTKKHLENSQARGKVVQFISGSLLLCLQKQHPNLEFTEKVASEIFKYTLSLGKDLTLEIFKSYTQQQKCFGKLIVDIIAEDKHLSGNVLSSLLQSINFSANKLNSLFITLRLSQYKVPFSEDLTNQIILILESEVVAERVLALNAMLNTDLSSKAVSAIIANQEKFSEYEKRIVRKVFVEQKISIDEIRIISPHDSESGQSDVLWNSIKD
ncbi:MAG: hypothetical protein ACHP65_09940, partial [Legionellales bacterium]